MKLRHLASLLPLILSAALVRAQDPAQPAAAAPADASAPAPAAAPKAPKTPLAKDMGKINKAYRTLNKQIKDPTQNDASLALLVTIHDAAVAASNETPAFTADQAPADQAKFVSDYQAKMKDFISAVDKVTADLTAGDNATAAVDAKKLGMDERAGHKEFRKPEDK
jgi:cytochrome c556